MPKRRRIIGWAAAAAVPVLALAIWLWHGRAVARPVDPWSGIHKHRDHVDHAAFFPHPLSTPQEATRSCLRCHEDAARQVMQTVHWKWEGDPVRVPGHDKPLAIGKKNLLNNFCLGIRGNWEGCCSCHAGYGWGDASFDFSRQENVDCLVCHDRSGGYAKGARGLPQDGVDLTASARSVGYPLPQNCAVCHVYGGGGMGVKHGDLDETLLNAGPAVDVHMGRHNLLCIDCHVTRDHFIRGTAYSVSIEPSHGVTCTDCHGQGRHRDERINRHETALACPTCHIPSFARKAPTKMIWDWSKAGDATRADDPHHYLKIKGEFVYEQDVTPEYAWFNRHTGRYLLGDQIDPATVTVFNPPQGGITDPESRIWPFKVHRARQPYDVVNRYLLQPVTSGEDGYWHFFDWDRAFRVAEKHTGLAYSGQYGFTDTSMYWPIAHMTAPAAQAVRCNECHGGGRMPWTALGYEGDPMKTGGRKTRKRGGRS